MFRSRRSAAPLPESVKVAEVVKAYYDAGRRPSSHLAPPSAPGVVEVPAEAPVAAPERETTFERDPAPAAMAAPADVPYSDIPAHSAPVHKSLAELAQELEAFIEVIRYGDDLGGTARN